MRKSVLFLSFIYCISSYLRSSVFISFLFFPNLSILILLCLLHYTHYAHFSHHAHYFLGATNVLHSGKKRFFKGVESGLKITFPENVSISK